jgi:hypothetical protein
MTELSPPVEDRRTRTRRTHSSRVAATESGFGPHRPGHRKLEAFGSGVGWNVRMGRLLQKAVAEASKLPEPDQEAFGAWMLAELESERRWDALFAKSGDLLSELAAEAVREDEAGLTEPLDPEAL